MIDQNAIHAAERIAAGEQDARAREQFAAEYSRSAKLQQEFASSVEYIAFAIAEARGLVKVAPSRVVRAGD